MTSEITGKRTLLHDSEIEILIKVRYIVSQSEDQANNSGKEKTKVKCRENTAEIKNTTRTHHKEKGWNACHWVHRQTVTERREH